MYTWNTSEILPGGKIHSIRFARDIWISIYPKRVTDKLYMEIREGEKVGRVKIQ